MSFDTVQTPYGTFKVRKSKLILRIFLEPNGKCPTIGMPGDAGIDLFADVLSMTGKESMIVKQFESVKVPLGFRCAFWERKSFINPDGTGVGDSSPSSHYYLEIRNRSGVGMKGGFTELASIVDSSYRGIPNACLAKVTEGEYEIKHGMKIVQGLIHPFVDPQDVDIILVDTIEELGVTDRSDRGFGSSGV